MTYNTQADVAIIMYMRVHCDRPSCLDASHALELLLKEVIILQQGI